MSRHFICNRRYYNNSGTDVFLIVKERYTRAGYRYLTLRSDLDGSEVEYKVNTKDGSEYIDLLASGPRPIEADDKYIICARNESSYIAISDKEQRFLSGEEVYVSFDELKRWITKLPLNSAMGFKIQRDPKEVEKINLRQN